MKLFEMFAGFGGASFALKKAGINFKCIGYSEIDKFAIKCYDQNHKDIKNFGDCTKINPNKLPDFDLLTGGFPCQSFSVAGKGLGELDPRGTLFWDIIRIAETKKPKYILLENVKGLTHKKHKPTFNKMILELQRIGYFVHWEIFNSKEHGIPQNRERIFFICFRDKKEYLNFKAPKKEELKIFLKDILEDKVDEKYYLSEKLKKQLLPHQKISYTIDANYWKGTTIDNFIKKKRRQIIQLNNPSHSNNRVYDKKGISPTLNSINGGDRQPFIFASRGRSTINPTKRISGEPTQQRLEPKFDGTTNTISTVQKDNYLFDGRVRKLTPKECFRLMGFLNDEINLENISNTQKYKLAGNGWDINLVSKILTQMLGGRKK